MDTNLVMRNTLVMPGNNPSMLLKADCFNADSCIFDLEDGVSPSEKDAARRLVVKYVKKMNYKGCSICVRVNNEEGLLEQDIAAIANLNILGIVVPKCEDAEIIHHVEVLLDKYTTNPDKKLKIIPVIESGKGVINAKDVIGASENIIAVHFGAGDYAGSVGITLSGEGKEVLFAKSMVVNVCSIFGIMPIDAPCFILEDEEALRTDVENSKKLGFVGKIAINPRHIDTINEAFTPNKEEIRFAKRIIAALEESDVGVISVDGKMIDVAMTKKAEKTLAIAKRIGVL